MNEACHTYEWVISHTQRWVEDDELDEARAAKEALENVSLSLSMRAQTLRRAKNLQHLGCNTLRQTATHYNTLQHAVLYVRSRCSLVQCVVACCNV